MYINNLGHMTKLAVMPLYGKNPTKIFSQTGVLISTKLGMKHRCLKYYNVYINHDPVLTLTYFKAMSTWDLMHLNGGELLTCHLKGNWQMDRILITLKTNGPRASSAPALGLNTI